ncbi:hypothetical protein [Glaciecola sp. HTCC2999]|jgi:uncharacterized protein YqgV (UPF0045/DUF77 family)|uniref:hypothetical protein n=1 Tax=Glaciecola sp. HTCC2999 TaxID=455436 RepID=UPI0000E11060|nr:hypothetical protein [Glaciecola sp. HTCC2999]
MQLLVDISLYPLAEQFIAPIQDFIDRLNTYPNLSIKTYATNTLVKGDYREVMQTLTKEMEQTHNEVGQAIFVCKFLNGDEIDINYQK